MDKNKRLYNVVFMEIMKALKKFKGNRTKAAEYLGLTRRGLQLKLKDYKDEGLLCLK